MNPFRHGTSNRLYSDLDEENRKLTNSYNRIHKHIDVIKRFLSGYVSLEKTSLEYLEAYQLTRGIDVGIFISSPDHKVLWLSKDPLNEILKDIEENMEFPDSLFIYIKELDVIVHLVSEDDTICSSIPKDKYHQEVIDRLTKELV